MEDRLRKLADLKARYDAHRLQAAATARAMTAALTEELAELRKACPHEKIVETGDHQRGCDDCDGRAGDHPAALCEVCGLIERSCGLYFDGFYHLPNKVPTRMVGGEEFERLCDAFPYHSFDSASR